MQRGGDLCGRSSSERARSQPPVGRRGRCTRSPSARFPPGARRFAGSRPMAEERMPDEAAVRDIAERHGLVLTRSKDGRYDFHDDEIDQDVSTLGRSGPLALEAPRGSALLGTGGVGRGPGFVPRGDGHRTRTRMASRERLERVDLDRQRRGGERSCQGAVSHLSQMAARAGLGAISLSTRCQRTSRPKQNWGRASGLTRASTGIAQVLAITRCCPLR